MISSIYDQKFVAGNSAVTSCYSHIFPYISAYFAADHRYKPMTKARDIEISITCGQERDIRYSLNLDEAKKLAESLLFLVEQEQKIVTDL